MTAALGIAADAGNHRGNLGRDRQMRDGADLDALAGKALQWALAGAVDLVQRRLPDGSCAYLAIRRQRQPTPRRATR